MAKEDFYFFYRSKFSQWSKTKFHYDGQLYNCCEQFMMAQKALLFYDLINFKHIMESDDPHEQKKLGRLVTNYDQKIWDFHKIRIVYLGNTLRFSQNPNELKTLIEETGDKLMVEASPVDKIWGIGLKANDPRAWDKKTWQGQNLLGKILTDVRDDLQTLFENTLKRI